MTVRTRRLLVGASFVAGVVLMIGSDRPWTRVLGIACLLGFVVAGLFVVADPEFLAGMATPTAPANPAGWAPRRPVARRAG